MRTIQVNLPTKRIDTGSYAITVSHGVLEQLGELTRSLGAWERVMLAVDSTISLTHGATAHLSLRNAGFEVVRHELIADEHHKSLGTVHVMYDRMLNGRLDRSGAVIALGGGIVGDVAGFAAATYMRGIPIVQVPTTLLAMVDAAIGGKTGVNALLPDGAIGKNLIGAFWQPRAVIVDPSTLQTLDDRHFRCGLAECVKHGMIENVQSTSPLSQTTEEPFIEFLIKNVPAMMAKDMSVLTELIARSAAIKAAFVMADERESGVRALLNLGHTFGHAIESQCDGSLHHGEAVAIGMMAAMQCSIETKRMTTMEADRVRTLLTTFGLPTRLPLALSGGSLKSAMQFDKKTYSGKLRLILPSGIGHAVIADDVPEAVVDRALQAIGAGA